MRTALIDTEPWVAGFALACESDPAAALALAIPKVRDYDIAGYKTLVRLLQSLVVLPAEPPYPDEEIAASVTLAGDALTYASFGSRLVCQLLRSHLPDESKSPPLETAAERTAIIEREVRGRGPAGALGHHLDALFEVAQLTADRLYAVVDNSFPLDDSLPREIIQPLLAADECLPLALSICDRTDVLLRLAKGAVSVGQFTRWRCRCGIVNRADSHRCGSCGDARSSR
ncbi:MAG: hypothetical protein HS104_16665 [Polyangiaceae bacterium]|nr:hypothetical protein [Polyangiaceae bacterium]